MSTGFEWIAERHVPFTDGNGNLGVQAWNITKAIMAWPQSPRDAWVYSEMFDLEYGRGPEGEVSALFHDAHRHLAESGVGGWIAGSVLTYYVWLLVRQPADASINKAQHLVRLKAKGLRLNGIAVPQSDASIRNYWAEYRPAAHLWLSLLTSHTRDLASFWEQAEWAGECAEPVLGIDRWRAPKDFEPKRIGRSDKPRTCQLVTPFGNPFDIVELRADKRVISPELLRALGPQIARNIPVPTGSSEQTRRFIAGGLSSYRAPKPKLK